MANSTKVTVLMALYNCEKYIHQSMESVLNQSHKNFEFLIINDCSTDRSVEIVESFRDERIKIYHNERNLGQTKSLNVGLKIASDEYIARIDADDVALPQWLEMLVNYVKDHSDVSVVSCDVFAIDECNKIKKLYKPPPDKKNIILRSLIASPINHVGSLLKRSDIMEVGGYDERYITAADYDLWGKLIRKDFKITTVSKILMAIREHAQSLSQSKRGSRELEEIIEISAKNIKQFSSLAFSDHDIQLFCRANYDESNLSEEDFRKAIDITKRIYANIFPVLNMQDKEIQRWVRHCCRTIYLKRIFSLINLRDYVAARKLSLGGIKQFGLSSVFLLFWCTSLFGGMVLNFIPELYKNILRVRARRQTVALPNMDGFN